MVAASKMRKAQDSALSGRPYAFKIYELLMHVKQAVDPNLHPMLRNQDDGKHLILIISPDKGLCGALNTNLFREATANSDENTSFVASGRKVGQFLVRTKRDMLADFPVSDTPLFAETKRIAQFCVEQFVEGKVSRFSVLYTQFVNTLVQHPHLIQILPVKSLDDILGPDLGMDISGELSEDVEAAGFKFEPSPHAVLDSLLPFAINSTIYQLFLSARASEHSARMVAMKNATENAKGLIKDLTLEYNKLRQAGITNELLEIATAQMALE